MRLVLGGFQKCYAEALIAVDGMHQHFDDIAAVRLVWLAARDKLHGADCATVYKSCE